MDLGASIVYDPAEGTFTRVRNGASAGTLRGDGYICFSVNKCTLRIELRGNCKRGIGPQM